MKDSAKLLNFNVGRKLNFKVFRPVGVGLRRKLFFDTYRGLDFDLNRELGFGQHGVVFRGYVCPVCKSSVELEAEDCDMCGVRFKVSSDPAQKKKGRKPPASGLKRPQTRTGSQQTSTSRKDIPDIFRCPVCGIPLYVGTQTCPGCGLMFGNSSHSDTKIPKEQPKKKRGGIMTWEEYQQKQTRR